MPPPAELKAALKIGPGTERPAIRITKTSDEADYILVGRLDGDRLEYAWIRPGVSAEEAQTTANPLPERTDWIDASDIASAATRLQESAVTLSRIRAWLIIQGGPADMFPYKLALKNAETGEIMREGQIREGESYSLVLISDEAALKQLQSEGRLINQRWVYVFSIGGDGKSHLLFNRSGNINNTFPLEPDLSAMQQDREIPLGKEGAIYAEKPFGLETFILLASEEPISDPYILEFDPVRIRGSKDSELSRLLFALGTASRSSEAEAPLNWSIDRIVLRSVPKSP